MVSRESYPVEDYLKPGDHLCSFYETKEEQFQIVLPFLANGLAKAEKCVYLTDENTAAEIKAGLLMRDVPVGRYLQSGQLRIVTARDSYLRDGRFDPHAIISFFSSSIDEAVKEDYTGLRVAGETSWILRDLRSLDDWIAWEAMVNVAFRNRPFKGLCQYNVKRFFGDMVVKVLKTHPRVLLGLDLFENVFYEPMRLPV